MIELLYGIATLVVIAFIIWSTERFYEEIQVVIGFGLALIVCLFFAFIIGCVVRCTVEGEEKVSVFKKHSEEPK